MTKNFYLTVCFIIFQLAAFGQDKTITFGNLPNADLNTGTQLGTTSFAYSENSDNFNFALSGNTPLFFDFNNQASLQQLFVETGDNVHVATLGSAKLTLA